MILTFFQTLVAILLIVAILLQQRGTALSGVFGGEGNAYATRRGMQKTLLFTTVFLVILFLGIALTQLFIGPAS